MTLRDWFAGQALAGLLAAEAGPAGSVLIDDIAARAEYAFRQAEAMLEQRTRKEPENLSSSSPKSPGSGCSEAVRGEGNE